MSSTPQAHPESAPAIGRDVPVSSDPTVELPAQDRPAREGMSPLDRRMLLGVAGLAGLAALSRRSKAGPLDPPPAPISPNYRTLQQIFDKVGKGDEHTPAQPACPIESLPGDATAQYVATTPGKYQMTRNAVQVPGKVVLRFDCDDAELDCNGFVFQGSAAVQPSSPFSSCLLAVGRRNLEVYGATFSSTKGRCIDFEDCDDTCLDDLAFMSCTGRESSAPSISEIVVSRDRLQFTDSIVSACSGCTCRGAKSMMAHQLTFAHCDGAALRTAERCECDDVTMSSCNGACIDVGASSSVSRIFVWSCSCDATTGLFVKCAAGTHIKQVQLTNVHGPGGGGGGGGIDMGDQCTLIELVVVIAVLARVAHCGDGCECESVTMEQVTGDGMQAGSQFRYHEWRWVSSSGQALQCGAGSCVSSFEMCDSTGGGISYVGPCDISDGQVTGCTGLAIHGGDDSPMESISFSFHTGDVIQGGNGCCACDCSFHSCSGSCVSLGARSTIDGCECTGGGGGGGGGAVTRAFTCGTGSCVCDCSISQYQGDGIFCSAKFDCSDCSMTSCSGTALTCGDNSNLNCVAGSDVGLAMQCGNSCSVARCDFKMVNGAGPAITCGNDCTLIEVVLAIAVGQAIACGSGACIDGCVVSQVSSSSAPAGDSAISCGPGSSLTDSEVRDCPHVICVVAQDSCGVCDNRVTNCLGMSLAGQCVCCSNEIITSDGPALSVQGPRVLFEDNDCSSTGPGGGGLELLSLSHGSVVDSNRFSPLTDGMTPTNTVAVRIAPGVTGCLVVSNVARLNGPPSPIAWQAFSFPPGSCNAFGPIVDASFCGSSGDLSLIPNSAHCKANIIH